ncbi:MAG: DUF1573 domain-containing protein [Deltaproteobacteria bacterium]|nr:DUF1573 domain-containing protein [Deltaproteobacteria bacterium]
MRTRFAASLVLAVVFLAVAPAHAAEEGQSAPDAYFPETSYEFSPVVEGSVVVHEFVIKNRGTQPLAILDVKST